MSEQLSRRSFLGSLTAGVAFSRFTDARLERAEEKTGRKPYADASLPLAHVRPVTGQRYEAVMPDTLDLADRAALAINGITRVADPADDYTIYMLGDFVDWVPGRAFLRHHWTSDLVCQPKFLEALPLLRAMSGSGFNNNLDGKMMDTMLHITASDGLGYLPMDDRPWRKHDATLAAGVPHASAFCEGRMILALNMWHQHDGNSLWSDLARKKIDKLRSLAVQIEDCLYFPEPVVYPGDFYIPLGTTTLAKGNMPTRWNAAILSAIAHGAAQYYDLSGYRPALELAKGLVSYYRRYGQVYGTNGRFTLSHFHISTVGLIGALQTALSAQDDELIAFVKQGYEFAKAMGEPLVGFFPEHLPTEPGQPDWKYYRARAGGRGSTCETCEVADMIVLAAKLSRAGLGDYWEDVERYTRNQFAENQMMRTDWVSKIPEVMANDKSRQPHRIVFPVTRLTAEDAGLFPVERKLANTPGYVDETDAAARLVGTWAGWSTANDFLDPVNGPGIMHCCTGNAARTLYYIWDSIVVPEAKHTRINLLLNRVSPWLDVHSHLPYSGRVELKIKKATAVALHIPQWTSHKDVRCAVNNVERAFNWTENYIEVGPLAADDVVTVTFPQEERRSFRMIGENIYHLTMRGDTVIKIDPQGELYPLYQRSNYRQGFAPLKNKSRFVCAQKIRW